MSTATPRNIAAIDAANLALDLIDNCVTPLTKAIGQQSADAAQVSALCLLLQENAAQYRDLFDIILNREQP